MATDHTSSKPSETPDADAAVRSRRDLLLSSVLGSASAAVAVLMSACGGGSSSSGSSTTPGGGNSTGTSGGSSTSPEGSSQSSAGASGGNANDIAILNHGLAAEFGAIKAYDAGIAILNEQHDAVAPVAKAVAQHFQSQHRGHADVLAAAVEALHGTRVTADSVTFTAPAGFPAHPTTTDVLKLAANAEKAAGIAYTNAVGQLSDPGLRFAAASIGGDETQHWIVLYLLLKGHVTPTASADPNDVVPRGLTAALGNDNPGLESIPDFTYA